MRAPSARSTRIVLAITAVVVAVLSWFFITDENGGSNGSEPLPPVATTRRDATVKNPGGRSDMVAPKRHFNPAHPAVAPLPPAQLAGADRSPLADELHSPARTGMDDLSVVMNLFTHYRTRFRSYPVGEENAAFVNALSGQNPGRLAFISRDHPAIDAKGQLLDRWGQPFFFHLLGHDALEVRSAGPDLELYTADDLLTASPVAQEAALAIGAR